MTAAIARDGPSLEPHVNIRQARMRCAVRFRQIRHNSSPLRHVPVTARVDGGSDIPWSTGSGRRAGRRLVHAQDRHRREPVAHRPGRLFGGDLLAGGCATGPRPASGPCCTSCCSPSCAPPASSTWTAARSTARASEPSKGGRCRPLAGRPQASGLQAPSDLRRRRHPAGRQPHRRESQRHHPAPPAAGRGAADPGPSRSSSAPSGPCPSSPRPGCAGLLESETPLPGRC